ncbi:hypothetical protein F0U59_26780 [Archangium gephyra]|nr:hypothetical protein F0U59_26780 [Archangium gephyra]
MSGELHPRFRQRLTEDQANHVVGLLEAFAKLRAALEHEATCVARWTLRVMHEGLGSPAESEALDAVRRAGERRADAAWAVEDSSYRLDESLSAAGKVRRPA